MPELPEVETICRGLESSILRQKIVAVATHQVILRHPIPRNLSQVLVGQSICKIYRRGKYILLETGVGTLIIHLGMSGNLQVKPQKHFIDKHEHFSITFASGSMLCYHDPRRFGAILWTTKDPLEHPLLKTIGPEPFAEDFTADYLFAAAKRKKSAVKQFIMDSKVVAGVGNIYANEALFAAGINPLQATNKISLAQFQVLVEVIKKLLQQAIKHGGTTIRDHTDSSGNKGSFQNELKVYGRGGQLCYNCQTKLKEIQLGQRSTVFCSKCQPL